MGIATTEDRGQRSKDPDPGSLSIPSCHVEMLTEPWHLACEPGTLGTGGTLGCTGSSASCWVSPSEEILNSPSLPSPNASTPFPVRSLSEQPFPLSPFCVILGAHREGGNPD